MSEKENKQPAHLKPHAFKPGNSGKPKGAKNKITQDIREAFMYAFDKSGGADSLAKFAANAKNKTAFYTLLARLLPTESKVESNTTIKGSLTTESVEKFDEWISGKPQQPQAAVAVVATQPEPEQEVAGNA
jgi:hypothetical protein